MVSPVVAEGVSPLSPHHCVALHHGRCSSNRTLVVHVARAEALFYGDGDREYVVSHQTVQCVGIFSVDVMVL